MDIKVPKVPELSSQINNLIIDESIDDIVTAFIVSLSMVLKRRGDNYEDFVIMRDIIIRRLSDLTSLTPRQFKEESTLLKQ